jgi:prepilin-type N-terminal cleavage/methylation domain-containing protein
MSRRRRDRGLTLIETIFALSIMAVAFLALMQAMLGSNSLSASSTEDSEAVLFAQNKVEEITAAFTGNGANFLTTYSASGTSYTNASPSYTYLNGTSSDLIYTNHMYSASPWTVPTTFGNGSSTAAGWSAPVYGSYLGSTSGTQVERLSRLGKPTVTVHFLSEYELYQATGIVDQIDLLTSPRTAPASDVPSPSSQTVSGISLWTFVTSNYSYFPFRVTVTWTPITNQTNQAAVARTISVMGIAYPPLSRAQ